MKDLFQQRIDQPGNIGAHRKAAHGYFTFPKLTGPISNKMVFQNKEMIIWSINNYLGLADHPEVRKADAEAAAKYGLASPMGARMMSGETVEHEALESILSNYVRKDSTILLNYGYQGMISIISAVCSRYDYIIYDSLSHACIIDGIRLSNSQRYMYKHNDIFDLEKQLSRAYHHSKAVNSGGILVITEGVFGMSGDQGKLREVCALKEKYAFRLLVDDAHGFGVMGKDGSGTGTEQNCQEDIDLYFATFAKSMASIGAFVSGDRDIIEYLSYNMRSQIFAKSLPTAIVAGVMTRLEISTRNNSLRDQLWKNAGLLQHGLRKLGFNLDSTNSPITPIRVNGDLNMAMEMIKILRVKHNVFCSLVVYPVIPKGQIILRLIPTAIHTEDDISRTLIAFEHIINALQNHMNQPKPKDLSEINTAED